MKNEEKQNNGSQTIGINAREFVCRSFHRVKARPYREIDIPESRVLNIKSTPVNYEKIDDIINFWIRKKTKGKYIVLTNVHTIMNAYDDPYYRKVIEDSSMSVCDGKPITLINRLKGYRQVTQTRGMDLMHNYIGQSAMHGVRHFFYGGKPGVASKLKATFEAKFPEAKIVGVYSPPFRSLSEKEDLEICNHINSTDADIIWVAIGAPKQDIWMYEHKDKLNVPVQIGVGAAFDFLTGSANMAPNWMQNLCLEWFYRFLQEPRRLFKRYIYNNPRFIFHVTLEMLNKVNTVNQKTRL